MPDDIRGRAIKVGDTVAYPGRHSSSLWMNLGTVVAIHTEVFKWSGNPKETLRVKNGAGRVVTVRKISNVVVVEGK